MLKYTGCKGISFAPLKDLPFKPRNTCLHLVASVLQLSVSNLLYVLLFETVDPTLDSLETQAGIEID